MRTTGQLDGSPNPELHAGSTVVAAAGPGVGAGVTGVAVKAETTAEIVLGSVWLGGELGVSEVV